MNFISSFFFCSGSVSLTVRRSRCGERVETAAVLGSELALQDSKVLTLGQLAEASTVSSAPSVLSCVGRPANFTVPCSPDKSCFVEVRQVSQRVASAVSRNVGVTQVLECLL